MVGSMLYFVSIPFQPGTSSLTMSASESGRRRRASGFELLVKEKARSFEGLVGGLPIDSGRFRDCSGDLGVRSHVTSACKPLGRALKTWESVRPRARCTAAVIYVLRT